MCVRENGNEFVEKSFKRGASGAGRVLRRRPPGSRRSRSPATEKEGLVGGQQLQKPEEENEPEDSE